MRSLPASPLFVAPAPITVLLSIILLIYDYVELIAFYFLVALDADFDTLIVDDVKDLLVNAFFSPLSRAMFALTKKKFYDKYFDTETMFGNRPFVEALKGGHETLAVYCRHEHVLLQTCGITLILDAVIIGILSDALPI